jgi:4-amino-4-deoxychorismate lyase
LDIIAFWNGIFCPEDEVKIPLNDRGFLFGDGVFTTLRLENGTIEALERHLKKLNEQCHALNLAPPKIKKSWLDALIAKNQAAKGIWRLKILLTGGNEDNLRLAPKRCGELIITLKPYKGLSYSPRRLGCYPTPIHSSIAKVKSLAYLERLLVKEYALNNGFDDCVVKDFEGHLLETAYANLFWRKEDQLFFPDPELPYYFGVSLERVMDGVKKDNINTSFIKAKEIPEQAQVYLCNSLIGICPVVLFGKQSFSRDLPFEAMLYAAYKSAS